MIAFVLSLFFVGGVLSANDCLSLFPMSGAVYYEPCLFGNDVVTSTFVVHGSKIGLPPGQMW